MKSNGNKTPSRVYHVRDSKTLEDFLVRANNPSQAITYVMRNRLTAEPASQNAIIECLQNGVSVDDARAMDPDPDSGQLPLSEPAPAHGKAAP